MPYIKEIEITEQLGMAKVTTRIAIDGWFTSVADVRKYIEEIAGQKQPEDQPMRLTNGVEDVH